MSSSKRYAKKTPLPPSLQQAAQAPLASPLWSSSTPSAPSKWVRGPGAPANHQHPYGLGQRLTVVTWQRGQQLRTPKSRVHFNPAMSILCSKLIANTARCANDEYL